MPALHSARVIPLVLALVLLTLGNNSQAETVLMVATSTAHHHILLLILEAKKPHKELGLTQLWERDGIKV